MIKYNLTVIEIATDKVVYENGFYTWGGVVEEQRDWDTDLYSFLLEEFELERRVA
jgi:hypothetical protein